MRATRGLCLIEEMRSTHGPKSQCFFFNKLLKASFKHRLYYLFLFRIKSRFCAGKNRVCGSYLGLSSGGALLKLTTGIWRVAGLVWSDEGRKGRGGRRGDRRGELRPRVRRRGERGGLETECCSSSFSSSSRMAGSFLTRPPLLSQSS